MSSGSSSYGSRKILAAIILAALAIRILYLVYYSGLPVWDQLTVDNNYHHNWAINISEGNIFGDTTYFRAPFYVFCLAVLYAIFGASLWVGRLFGVLVGVLSVFMTYRIGRRVFSQRVGLIAAAIQTIYPMHLYFEGELLLDPLFTLLVQLAVDRVLVWWDTRQLRLALAAGLMFGLAAITRPTAFVFLIPVAILMIIRLKAWRQVTLNMLVLVGGLTLVILPVTIRNVVVASDPVLISSQGGINLYIGNNDAADGVSATLPEPLGPNWRIRQITHIAESEEGRPLKPGEVSSYWLRQANDWITANPVRFLRLYIEKFYRHISNREISNNRILSVFFDDMPFLKYNPFSFGILFALSLAGCLRWARRNKRASFLLALLVAHIAVSAVFFFSSRFRLPLLPFFTILASATLLDITTDLFTGIRRALPTLSGVLACGLISFYPLADLPTGSPSQHLISRGIYFLATDDYEQALDAFTRARQIDPTFPETNLNIGATCMRLGNIDSALYYFNEEKRYNPGRVKADMNVASIALLRREYRQAVALIGPAIQSAPYDVIANTVLLRALFGDTLAAYRDLRDSVSRASERTGNDIFMLNEVAIRFTERGDLSAAEMCLRAATESHPPPIETDDYAFERLYRNSAAAWQVEKALSYYQWGYIKGLAGQYDLAIQYSRQSIDLDSTRVEAYVNLISGYLATGRTEEARKVLAIASARFPNEEYLNRFGLR